MFERAYRQRLEGDLERWQTQGVIAPAVSDAIRTSLGPLPTSINIATVVGMVGGLLIAAGFLAFIAANWNVIARPARFGMLLAGIAGAYALGAWFDRSGRTFLADTAVAAGCIIFGAAIALVGQMYHLGGDFAGALFLWAAAALIAAALTGSRGALAVALAAGCVWSQMRIYDEAEVPHLAFVAFWLVAAGLSVAWNSPVARHLVAVTAIAWWTITAFAVLERVVFLGPGSPILLGTVLLVGAGLLLSSRGTSALLAFGTTLSTYGAFAFAIAFAIAVADRPAAKSSDLAGGLWLGWCHPCFCRCDPYAACRPGAHCRFACARFRGGYGLDPDKGVGRALARLRGRAGRDAVPCRLRDAR